MISSQYVTADSSWNAVYPYSLSSALTVTFDIAENGSQDETIEQISSVALEPPDDNPGPVTLLLKCERDIHIKSLHAITNARHMEVYDDRGQYIQTLRGHKEDKEGLPEKNFKKTVQFGTSLPSCSMKFLSLADKGCLKVFSLRVTVTKTRGDETRSYPKKQIDMTKVRDMLSSMPNSVPENVEQLMQTVERYQENQSSVWSEVQQQALTSASRNPSATPMVGMMTMLARTGQRSNTGEDSNTVNDAMSKVMASMTGSHGNDRELYNTLQGICRNVSQMRVDENKQQQRRDQGEEAEKEASGTEKEPASAGAENTRWPEVFARSVATQLAAMEERMMGRLERRLDQLETRLELRLNRIEAVIEDIAKSHRNTGQQSKNDSGAETSAHSGDIAGQVDTRNGGKGSNGGNDSDVHSGQDILDGSTTS